MHGARLLGRYPFETVRVACSKCNRTAEQSRADLIKEHGPDYGLPDLRHDLTPGCGLKNPFSAVFCGAYYPDLVGP